MILGRRRVIWEDFRVSPRLIWATIDHHERVQVWMPYLWPTHPSRSGRNRTAGQLSFLRCAVVDPSAVREPRRSSHRDSHRRQAGRRPGNTGNTGTAGRPRSAFAETNRRPASSSGAPAGGHRANTKTSAPDRERKDRFATDAGKTHGTGRDRACHRHNSRTANQSGHPAARRGSHASGRTTCRAHP